MRRKENHERKRSIWIEFENEDYAKKIVGGDPITYKGKRHG